MKEILFENKIWKIVPDSQFNSLYIETRSQENQKIAFYHFNFNDFSNQKVNIEENQELFWSSLAGESNGVIILSHFEDKEIPLNSGVSAFDAKTGIQLWYHSDIKLIEIQQDSILGKSRSNPDEIISVHLHSGIKHSPLSPPDNAFPPHSPLPYHFPEFVLSQQEDFKQWSQKINMHFQHNTCFHIDFLTIHSFEIVNYYTRENHLSQYIAVLGKNQPLVHKCLYSQLNAMTYEPFFVLKNWLITIKEGNILCVLNLS